MTPAQARIKAGVIETWHLCGGKSGVAITVGRAESTVGEWRNLNATIFPPVDCAMLMDQIAVMQSQRPAILCALAAELGHVVIRLPDTFGGSDEMTCALIEASAEFGEIAAEVRDATRDGVVTDKERDRIVRQVDDAVAALARLRAVVAKGPQDG